jgi:type II secretory pathway component PulJ
MKTFSKRARSARGYLLLEVVLAMGIFALAATGYTVALQKAADASDMAAREMQIRLKSLRSGT